MLLYTEPAVSTCMHKSFITATVMNECISCTEQILPIFLQSVQSTFWSDKNSKNRFEFFESSHNIGQFVFLNLTFDLFLKLHV